MEAEQPAKIRNIKSLALEIQDKVKQLIDMKRALDIYVSPEYERGFRDGVNSLQTAFLRAMEAGELDYEKVNR